MRRRSAFTLIEILVVVAIIALLVAILIPSLSQARERTRRVMCTSNVRQITIAGNMYANSMHPQGYYIPRGGTGGSDGLRGLYPRFLRQLNIAVCPNTVNVVKRPEHLDNNARGPQDASGGHSYEMRDWMWSNNSFNGKLIRPVKVWNGTQFVDSDPIKSTKNVTRPSQVCLLMDADDAKPEGAGDTNNWPDREDNHGLAGLNVGYCDGHANWVRTGRPLLMAFLTGYYNPNLDSALYTKYKVTRTSSGNITYFTW